MKGMPPSPFTVLSDANLSIQASRTLELVIAYNEYTLFGDHPLSPEKQKSRIPPVLGIK
jgi:hypothetical protein